MAGIATFVNALAVSSNTPAKNLAEYMAWVKNEAKRGSIGIPAPASTPEFLVKILAEHYKLDLVAAPYRGSAHCWPICWATRFRQASLRCRTSWRTTRPASCA